MIFMPRCLLLVLLAFLATASPASAQIVLNEIVSANDSTLSDENGDYSDWFEIFNSGASEVELTGWGLSDAPKQPFKWVLRDARLKAGEFMTVFASGKDRQPDAILPQSPGELAGLRLWLRADAVATNDAAQVRIADGNIFVRHWLDQSSEANDAAQEGSASQPVWIASGANGKPSLRFDGGGDVLTLARPSATNSFTVLAVVRTSVPHQIDGESASGIGGTDGQHWLFGPQHGGDFDGGSGLSIGTNGISAYEHGSSYMPALAVFRGMSEPDTVWSR